MPVIKGSISPTGGTDSIILVLYKTTAPGVEVDRQVKTPPHDVPWNFEFNDLVNGNYTINAHWSTNGVDLGTLIHDWWTPAYSATGGVGVVQFLGGTDVSDGDTEYHDTSLEGKQLLLLYEEGTRPLRNGIEWEPISTGGVRLLGDRTFSDSGVWTVQYAEIVISDAPAAGGAEFIEIVEQPGDVTLSVGDVNKCIVATGTGPFQLLTLPPAGSISLGGYLVQHDGRGPINVRVEANGTDSIRFRGEDLPFIDLGVGEELKVIKTASGWRVRDPFGQWERVGLLDAVREPGVNQIPADGLILYDGDQYRRLYEFLQTLPGSAVVTTQAAWDQQQTFYQHYTGSTLGGGRLRYINRGKFFLDTVNNKFRTPDMRGKYVQFLGTGSGHLDQSSGSFRPWAVGDHSHSLPIQDFGNQDIQSMVVNANADEGLNEGNRTGRWNPAADNHVENIGLIAVINI